MLLVSEALTPQGQPIVTALAATVEGGHVHCEALHIREAIPAGPLPCTLHKSKTQSEQLVIDWPGYPAGKRAAVPSNADHFTLNLIHGGAHYEQEEGH